LQDQNHNVTRVRGTLRDSPCRGKYSTNATSVHFRHRHHVRSKADEMASLD